MGDDEFQIRRFRLQPHRQLLDGDHPVAVGRKALALLTELARAEGELVTKEELMAAVWPRAIVNDNALHAQMTALRRDLGAEADCVRTVHGLGYRLADVSRIVAKAKEGAPRAGQPRIAVLPFESLSDDRAHDLFADGIVEEIIAALTRFRSIFVIASGSTQSFRGRNLSAQAIAEQLSVRYVLSGSVRRASGQIRVVVRLTDSVTGEHIFADRFEDAEQDVFDLQDRVALAVAAKIEPTLEVVETRRSSTLPAHTLGAYELYLRAWALERTFQKANVFEAMDLLNAAIALDPGFAPALALAAICHRVIFNFRWTDDPEAILRAGIEFGRRALVCGADDARVLVNVGSTLACFEPTLPDATKLNERALALNSGSATVWFYSGVRLLQIGDLDRGIEHLEAALRLDPLGPDRPSMIGFLGQGRFQQGRFSEAVDLLRETLRESDTPRGAAFLAAALGQLGRTAEAAIALARFHEQSPQTLADLAHIHLLDPAHYDLFMAGIAAADAPE